MTARKDGKGLLGKVAKTSHRNQDRFFDFLDRSRGRALMRDPAWQQAAIEIVRRYPGLPAAVGAKKDDTAGIVLFRALSRINDSSLLAENLELLGLPSDTPREVMYEAIARAAPELGATFRDVERTLNTIEEIEIVDHLWVREFEEDLRRPDADEDIKLRDDEYAKRAGDEALRNTVAALYSRGEQQATRRDPRRQFYHAPSSLHASIERAYEAQRGRHSRVDPDSYGGREWRREAAERLPEAVENEAVVVEQERADIEARASADQEYEASLQRTPLEAEVAAQWASRERGGGDEE